MKNHSSQLAIIGIEPGVNERLPSCHTALAQRDEISKTNNIGCKLVCYHSKLGTKYWEYELRGESVKMWENTGIGYR